MLKIVTNLLLMPLALFIFISQSALSTDLITDSKLKEWIKSHKNLLPEVVINEDGGIDNTTANLEALAKIEYLTCTDFKLVSIDELIRHMPNLKKLECTHNSLNTLDLSNNIKLKMLECSENKLSNLDLSKNINLERLYCYRNQLVSLDLTANIKLNSLICFRNQLTILELTSNIELEELNCSINQLSNLDISKNIKLKELHCSENQLTYLDLSKNINLELLDCSENQLTTLDISNNKVLMVLTCVKNQLSSLDVSRNIGLISLNCNKNILASLDISYLPKLNVLNCCNQAEGFILYLTNKQKNKFTKEDYCNAILKEKPKSISELEWFDIHPNPTAGNFFVDSKFLSDEIKILNLAGEVLYKSTLNSEKTEIDISTLPAGVYFVITKGKTGKVVKN